MNLTRRNLFRTLSALAVAPLVKWLPKAEAKYIIGCDVASEGACYTVLHPAGRINAQELDAIVAQFSKNFNRDNGWIDVPIPQEDWQSD